MTTQTAPKFSELILQGAGLTDPLFYCMYLAPTEEHPRPRACALGAACYAADKPLRKLRDPLDVSFRVTKVFDTLINKYNLNTLVTLKRADFPELFADLEQAGLAEGEDELTVNLAHHLIPKLNDFLQYPIPRTAAIVRQLGY
jgi:hypothetical protein